MSPSVRRLVEENKLDPGAIPASGKDGRLTKSDVVDFLGKKPTPVTDRAEPPAPVGTGCARSGSRPPTVGSHRASGCGISHRATRTDDAAAPRIAQRLVEAQSTQALLTSFNEVDMTAVMELRNRYKDRSRKTMA